MSIVYLNGRYLPQQEACVPVMDRGYLFGDGVYEVIPSYGGHLFRLDQHLARLEASLAAVDIPNPLRRDQWAAVLEELLRRHPWVDQGLYLQVTRGVAGRRDHVYPQGDATLTPTVLAMTNPIPEPDPQLIAEGVSAVTLTDLRWGLCNVKATTLLANVLARQAASAQGAAEAILVREGEANEGAASNLFLVRDGTLVTPPKSAKLLPGITRDLVLEIALEAGIDAREAAIRVTDLAAADELWLTSSTKEVLAVTRLDGHPVGDGHPGPLYQRMRTLYQARKQALRSGAAH